MALEDDRPFQLPRPEQLEALSPDQVVAVVLRLAMELSVLRDRLRTHEQLLAEHNLLSPESVDGYSPSREEAAARMDAGRKLIEQIIGDLSS
ncbi:MAG: hypothetical protein AAF358_02100 [Pseudomonadota bacterium]